MHLKEDRWSSPACQLPCSHWTSINIRLIIGFCKPAHPIRKQHEFGHLRPKKWQDKIRRGKGHRGPPPSSSRRAFHYGRRTSTQAVLCQRCPVGCSKRIFHVCHRDCMPAGNNVAPSPPFTSPKGHITSRDIANQMPATSARDEGTNPRSTGRLQTTDAPVDQVLQVSSLLFCNAIFSQVDNTRSVVNGQVI